MKLLYLKTCVKQNVLANIIAATTLKSSSSKIIFSDKTTYIKITKLKYFFLLPIMIIFSRGFKFLKHPNA
jgi:hypothetical protein